MLHTIIQKNSYQDSIVLMLLTNKISTIDGVNKVSIMMGTPANKDIFKTGGLYTEELEKATANDMVLVLDAEEENVLSIVLDEIPKFLEKQASATNEKENIQSVNQWDKATKLAKEAKVALVSIPGTYAALEIERALDENMHVFCFSDNVSIEDEKRLKEKAHQKGLVLMGPDCGTSILNGIPLAFTNHVRRGKIGIVGASGTGIQEVTTLIHKAGEGVSHAIGTGGRDLKDSIGGITFLDSLALLAQDEQTEVIVALSKPTSTQMKTKIMSYIHTLNKPVVTLFLGEEPTEDTALVKNAYTLAEAAHLAVSFVRQDKETFSIKKETVKKASPSQRYIKGLYSGGTLASEAAMLLTSALSLDASQTKEVGYVLKYKGHEIIDLGDDMYTQGKPHPMIDPENRLEKLKELEQDDTTSAVLIDFVLGYGSHTDMVSELLPTIQSLQKTSIEKGNPLTFIAVVVGTDLDPQGYRKQVDALKDAGIIVAENNVAAVTMALDSIGKAVPTVKRQHQEIMQYNEVISVPDSMKNLLTNHFFLNIGLKSFATVIEEQGGKVVQFDWKPIAGGNVILQKALTFLRNYVKE